MSHDPCSCPLPTSLESIQTTLDCQATPTTPAIDDLTPWHQLTPREKELVSRVEPLSAIERSFRHRGWLADRRRVVDALANSGMSLAGLERFRECGGGAVVEIRADGTRHRVRGNYCGHRFCQPCARARARVVRDNLLRWINGQPVLFITLTLRQSTDSLVEVLDHLKDSFTRLRNQKFWKAAVKAAAAFTEITRGASGDHWHVHLHVLAVSRWVDQEQLSQQWEQATGGSFIVHVRRVQDTRKQVQYVASYATKGFSRDVVLDRDALIECIVSLRGRRLLSTYGGWGRLCMEEDQGDTIGWRRVGRLVEIVNNAARGCARSQAILRDLRVVAIPDAGEVSFVDLKREPPPP